MLLNFFRKNKKETTQAPKQKQKHPAFDLISNSKETINCKCCGQNTAEYYDSVDLNKNCEEHKGQLKLDKANVEIAYHKCSHCGFLFTAAFDGFTGEDWGNHIYNDDYILVDPDYTGSRAKGSASLIKQMFPNEDKPKILDFGGGKGILAETLNKEGFSVDTYDPYSGVNNIKPEHKYKIIFSFEVVEHSPNPIQTFNEIFELLDDGGVVIFSTLLQPNDFPGISWWYAGPRNGHISLHTPNSMAYSIREHKDYVIAPFGQGLHIMFNPNNRPEFSNPWFGK